MHPHRCYVAPPSLQNGGLNFYTAVDITAPNKNGHSFLCGHSKMNNQKQIPLSQSGVARQLNSNV